MYFPKEIITEIGKYLNIRDKVVLKIVFPHIKITTIGRYKLNDLSKLNLSHNRGITDIPSLSNLTYLDLSYNNRVIDIHHLTSLTCLDLNRNKNITDIDHLTNLKYLNIDNKNTITYLKLKKYIYVKEY